MRLATFPWKKLACLGFVVVSASIGNADNVDCSDGCGAITSESVLGCAEATDSGIDSCGEPLFDCITPLTGQDADWRLVRSMTAPCGFQCHR